MTSLVEKTPVATCQTSYRYTCSTFLDPAEEDICLALARLVHLLEVDAGYPLAWRSVNSVTDVVHYLVVVVHVLTC